MAVTESVKIVFEVENKELDATLDKLVKQKVITEEAAQGYRDLAKATAEADAAQRKNAQSVDQYIAKIAQAKDTVARLTKENQGLKNFVDFKSSNAAVQEINKKFLENEKLIRAAKLEAKQFQEELNKLDPKPVPTEEFVSLRTRLREAKEELAQLEEKFGVFSAEANAARARAGELADQMSDLNRQVNLLNPESKIQAFTTLGQGIVGAFQTATGALQAFGAENEQVQAVAQRLQGALNIVQGVQSIIQLKEAYQDVKAVLGFTTAAQTALTTATTAGTVATEGAAVATRGFAAALTSTGIGAIVVALGALVGAYIALQSSTESYALSEQQLKDIKDQSKAATDALADAENDLAVKRGEKTQQAVETEKLIKSISEQIGQARVRELAAEKALAEAQQNYNLRIKAAIADNRQEEIDFITTRLNNAKATKQLASDEIAALKAQFNAKKELIDIDAQDKKNQDDAAKAKEKAQKAEEARQAQEQRANDAIAKRLAILSEEQKLRAFNVELNKLYGASEEEILRQKLFNNQADQDALDAILAKAKGTSQYDSVQSQLNDKVREEILLRKQLESALEIPLVPLKNQLESQQDINKELEKTGPIAVKVNSQWKGSAQELIDQEDELARKQQERIDRAFEIANGVTDIFIEAVNRQNEEEIASLEDKREKGLITEEQYEARLKKLKQKAAEDQKKAQVFQATMAAAQAILSAASGFYFTPAERIAAIAFASTISAINLAKVIATPIPKFKKGTLSVPGYDTGDDSVHAMLRPGEAVIPTEINREYASAIKAIYTRKVSAKDLNEFVAGRMSVVKDEPVFSFNPITLDALYKRDLRISQMSSAVQRSTGGTMPTINVKADLDTYALGKVITKNRGVELTNPEQVAKALAAELNKSNNRRRQ